MTKNEILDTSLSKMFPDSFENGALNAMDEYAKQFGEKLIGWLNDNDFKPSSYKDNMQSDLVNNGQRMHASEIVDLFIEQQRNQQ